MKTPPPDDETWWTAKWIEVTELFSPTAPVEESDLFAGRGSQLGKLVEVTFQRGQHAIVYGDRGVGKTSLINTYQKKIFPTSSRIKFFSTRCFSGDDFVSIWDRILKGHQWEDGTYASDDIDDAMNPYTILELFDKFKKSILPVFIFDEFDRIADQDTKLVMAETVKLLSDESTQGSVVVVGIGRTIRDLLTEHESVRRALRQIPMPRMSPDEIRSIITVRLARLDMTMEEQGLQTIVTLSKGMPGYAHLLGMHSAGRAIGRRSLSVTFDDVAESLPIVIDEAGESTRQDYARAIQSSKPNNQFREVLLACALARPDEDGRFTAAAVREPISEIFDEPRDIPTFARHLTAFCSEERAVLTKEGTARNYRFGFTDPMMQPYVIIRGLREKRLYMQDGVITPRKQNPST